MEGWLGPALIAAIVSALVTALSWYVGHWRDLAAEARRRRERIIDVQTALRAEIRSRRHRLASIDIEALSEQLIERMEADDAFVPFIPGEVAPFIFDAIAPEIHILPTEVIDPVVLFYQQARVIGHLADDMRDGGFSSLAVSRRIAVYRDYIAMSRYLIILADEALAAIDHSLRGPPDLNSRVSGRSDRQ